jgi:hypothetical protein
LEDLYGKSIKDKREVVINIHSWTLAQRSSFDEQCILLNKLLKNVEEQWAKRNWDWIDGWNDINF